MTLSTYSDLASRFETINTLDGVLNVLHWDGASMMPSGGMETRTQQLSTLSVLKHQWLVAEDIKEGLLGVEQEMDQLSDWQKANVVEMKKQYHHASALPEDLVKAQSEAGSRCEALWRTARKENRFDLLRPALEEVLNLTRQGAQIKGEALGKTPYEALLDQYEPDGTVAEIDALFEELMQELPSLIQDALDTQARRNQDDPLKPCTGPFADSLQKEVGLKMMDALGFDFNHGRLDQSAHPFCGGTPQDVRITTRYRADQFLPSLMGVIHETGHALYEQNLPKEWMNQPVGSARGMSIHESQSLFMEMQVGRHQSWVQWMMPTLDDAFNLTQKGITSDQLYRHVTQVERSLIRVDADEVTYPTHVVLRYKLEKAMLAGDLEIKDLPDAWSDGLLEVLGVRPDSDQNGCMQDIHWMDGSFGYFPTYTLGAMTAAQLFATLRQEYPKIDDSLRQGDLTYVRQWLQEKIHSKASSLSTQDLLIQATGRPLSVSPFLEHLRNRYL
jgi:carboxypeptidase Taq